MVIFLSARRAYTLPCRCASGRSRIARGEQHLQLMRLQCARHLSRIARPIAETPGRQAFLDQIKSLAVVTKCLDGGASTAAKNKKPTRKRVGPEYLLTDPRQTVYPVAEVHRFDRYYDAHVRGHLNHRFIPQNVRVSAARSGRADPFTWIRILGPRGFSSSMLHSETAPELKGGSSINVGPVGLDSGTVASCRSAGSTRSFRE